MKITDKYFAERVSDTSTLVRFNVVDRHLGYRVKVGEVRTLNFNKTTVHVAINKNGKFIDGFDSKFGALCAVIAHEEKTYHNRKMLSELTDYYQ